MFLIMLSLKKRLEKITETMAGCPLAKDTAGCIAWELCLTPFHHQVRAMFCLHNCQFEVY